MPEKDDVFVNPSAPPGSSRIDVEATPSRLTNADFRRLLMTPRVGGSSASLGAGGMAGLSSSSSTAAADEESSTLSADHAKTNKAEERRKKKSYYAKLKRAEEDIMEQLAKKYRDRAKERREGGSGSAATEGAGDGEAGSEDQIPAPGAYRALAPDLKSVRDAAERRRQQIQESKFLGGDMEHTHLVKGLDYALLQKVRSEIQAIEQQHEDEMEHLVDSGDRRAHTAQRDDEPQFRTKIAKNIHRTLFGDAAASKNELFRAGRMAYRIDLDDEFVDFDIPTTIIRSKADCPQVETVTTLTTNDIVINKLTQILSYLRQGRTGRRLRRKERGTKTNTAQLDSETAGDHGANDDIYADAGEYTASSGGKKSSDANRQQKGDVKPVLSYFDDGSSRSHHTDKHRHRDAEAERRDRERTARQREHELAAKAQEKLAREAHDKERYEQEKSRESNWLGIGSTAAVKKQSKGVGLSSTEYAECYPGFDEMHDAIDDSDEEADFTKMDQGNKKGPMGRWDFANPDEYSDYMNRKEALPKAAFQYGVKMADGRKTQGRKLAKNSEKSERAELDREWQKISDIISKRRSTSSGSASKKQKS